VTEEDTNHRGFVIIVILVLALLTVALPVGLLTWARTSQANFAESEEVGVNRLGTATADIEVGAVRALLGARNMAPGDVATGSVDVRNAGSLPLRYAVTAEINQGPLVEWLRWDIWAQPAGCSTTPPASLLREAVVLTAPVAEILGDPLTGRDPGDRRLGAGQQESLCFAARLPINASNVVQGAEIAVDFIVDAEHDIEPTP